MQLHKENNVLQTNLQTKAHVFQIHASAKAFKILSSNLYRYKVAAVIRELSCNALDSHVDAGNKDPFVIHLPTAIEPFFAVEDFGTGMTPDQIGELYTGYFASSKTDRNDQIGALGLGSKSPFAYTDMFTIDSVKDGLKSTYSAFLDQEGMPTYMLVKSGTSTQHPGVRITFPVPESDFYEFAREAATIFWAFNESDRPTITGAVKAYKEQISDFSKAVSTYEGKNWKIYKCYPECVNRKFGWDSGALVRMGNILYPIKSLESDSKFEDVSAYINNPLIIDMPLGACDINPSREELSYDDLTKANIHEKLEEIQNELAKQGEVEINKADTVWNAARAARTYFSTILKDKNASTKFNYNGVSHFYGEARVVKTSAYAAFYGESSRRSSKTTVRLNTNNALKTEISVQLGHNVLIIIIGDKAADNQYIRNRIKAHCDQNKIGDCQIWLVKELQKADYLALGQPPVIHYADLPKPAQQKKQAAKGKVTKFTSGDEIDITSITSKVKIYIVDYKKKYNIDGQFAGEKASLFGKKGNEITKAIREAFQGSDLLPTSIKDKIYIVPSKTFSQLNLAHNREWRSLESVLTTGLNHILKKKGAMAGDATNDESLLSYYSRIIEHADHFEAGALATNSPFRAALQLLVHLKSASKACEKDRQRAKNAVESVSRVLGHVCLKGVKLDAIWQGAVQEDTFGIFQTYPMVYQYLRSNDRWDRVNITGETLRRTLGRNGSQIDADHPIAIQDIIEYIQMVDKANGIN